MITFSGFKPEDFDNLAGSTWRSRDTLGGLLSRQLGRPYQSWGVARRLELHIARKLHYDFYNPWPFAKLFVSSYDRLAFGFYVETPASTADNLQEFGHWRRFRDRLQSNKAMREALVTAMRRHDLMITDYYRQETGGALGSIFAYQDGVLRQRQPSSPDWHNVEVDSLIKNVARLPEDQWVDLHVFKTIDQTAAIEMGDEVVYVILRVLRDLVPIYEMTIAEPGNQV
jgi:hypothetical protein